MSTIQSEAMTDLARSSAGSRAAEIVVCLTVPVVVFSFSNSMYPAFQPLKEALLMILGGGLFAVALAAGWLARLPRMWSALVTLYGGSILAAWAGSYEGKMGADASLAMLAAPLFACAALAVVRRRVLVIEIIAATGAVEAAIAVAQWLAHWDPHQVFYRASVVIGFLYGIATVRPVGTIGTSDVVALVVAASFPATLVLAGDRNRARVSRVLWLALALLDLTAIAGTACRASLVGALAGGAVVAVSRFEHLRRRTILTLLAIACLLGAAFMAARIANRRNDLNVEEATSARTFAWRVSLARWPGTALLGSGPGTFRFVYIHREGEWLREHNFKSGEGYPGANSDVQNDFLQARLETGWFGLAALVIVLAWWMRVAIAGIRTGNAEQKAVATAALGGVLALVLVSMVETCFQYAPSRMLIWLWMALPLTFVQDEPRPSKQWAAARWAVAVAVVTVFAWGGGRIILSTFVTERGYRREFAGDLAGAIHDDRRAAQINPLNGEARYHLGRAQWKAGDISGALRTLDDAVTWDAHPRVYEMRIRVLARSGRLPEALRRASEAARIFPWYPTFQEWRNQFAAQLLHQPHDPEPRR
jgi:hypothetical protein